MQRMKATLPGQDQSEIMTNMHRDMEKEALNSAFSSAGERGLLTMWLTESAADLSHRWLKSNGSKSVREHPAYVAALPKLMARICTCQKEEGSCQIHDMRALTLADLLWTLGDTIFEVVPSSVPSLAVAVNLKAHDESNPGIPEFCNFLCEEKKETNVAWL